MQWQGQYVDNNSIIEHKWVSEHVQKECEEVDAVPYKV